MTDLNFCFLDDRSINHGGGPEDNEDPEQNGMENNNNINAAGPNP